INLATLARSAQHPIWALSGPDRKWSAGGAEGNRTPDLCSAIAALSHLSYSPAPPAGSPPDGVGPLGKRGTSRDSSALQSPVPPGLPPAETHPSVAVTTERPCLANRFFSGSRPVPN